MTSVTEEIKSRLDLVDIVSETVQLRKSGRSHTGFCPFHQNTRTPAFVVFPETQTWRCFGACAEGGDLFSYVMKKEGWDFRETLQKLAERAGVSLEEHSPAELARREAHDMFASLLTAAGDYFHHLLLHAPQAEHARHYISNRSLEEETVATFKVGYALNSWDACRSHFNGQGYSDDDLVAVGLLSENPERNTRYDRFRNRLMIPIRDVSGQVVGFGARTLDPDGIPKYLNSPQTELFDKSGLLFGLDLARRHIREARQVVIVEGYMDVMQGWQHGFRNLVAQMGTALTGAQLHSLKRYTKRFVIALDADAAGLQATMRSLEVARESLDRELDVRFDAAHLLRHEGRLQADIRVVSLPEGNDPDKIMREDATLWPQLVAGARPVVEYVIDVTTTGLDVQDAKAKADIVRRVMPLIQDVADPVERDHYRQHLARKLRVDERALQQVALSEPRGEARPRKPAQGASVNAPPSFQPPEPIMDNGHAGVALRGGRIAVSKREANYLGECLRYFPELLDEVDRSLMKLDQDPVSEADFSVHEDRALWRMMRQQVSAGAFATFDELWDSLDRVLRPRVQALSVTEEVSPTGREKLPDLLALSILDIRLERVKRQLNEVQQLLREAQHAGDVAGLELYRQQTSTLPIAFQRLNRAKWMLSAASRRQIEAIADK